VAGVEVRALRTDEVAAAAAMLGRAFFDDPLLAYALPDPHERRQRAAAHFAPVVRQALEFGEVSVTADLQGVACWRAPGRHDPTPSELAASELDRMAELIGPEADDRLTGVFDYLHERRLALALPDDLWYLAVMGVDEDAKGRGVGSALLRSRLDALDGTGAGIVLETVAARNVAFYERNGFRCLDRSTEPVSGLTCWIFMALPGIP
jgi:GNAT superfamily N-acetyltransferase